MAINNKNEQKIIKHINELYNKYKELSNEEIKDLYNKEKDLKILLAVIKIAFERLLDITLYDEQLLAAYHMLNGNIIEMKTGEGKTFVCIIVSLIRCKIEKTYVVTINNVLAARDCATAKIIFNYFDKVVNFNLVKKNQELDKNLYLNSDCVYTSVSKLIFDYLEDRDFFIFASVIIDEVDYVLIDNATSQFSLSMENMFFQKQYRISNNAYILAKEEISNLKGKEIPFVLKKWSKYYKDKEYDYFFIDNYQTCFLTEKGLNTLKSLSEKAGIKYDDYFISAFYYTINANHLYQKDRDYSVKSNGVSSWIELIDPNNGRSMQNSSKEFELQHAIELKEAVGKTSETSCSETISMQLFFTFFPFLTGMSGTVGYSRNEFKKNFNKNTKEISTHLPMIREDNVEIMFSTKNECYAEALKLLQKYKDSPFLLVCESEKEIKNIKEYFDEKGEEIIVFSTNNIEEENNLISRYQKENIKVLTTSLMGRGTDIKISEKAKKEHGLIVIILGKFRNKRIEQQMKGRAGRQGEKGKSYCFYSIEDYFFHSVTEKHYKKLQKYATNISNSSGEKQLKNIEKANRYTERMQQHLLASSESHRYQVLHFDINIDLYFSFLRKKLKGINLFKEIQKANPEIYNNLILKTKNLINATQNSSIVEDLYDLIVKNLIVATKADLYWQICDISATMQLPMLEDSKRDYMYYFYTLPALNDYEKELFNSISGYILKAKYNLPETKDNVLVIKTNSEFEEFINQEAIKIAKNIEIEERN